MNLPNNKQGDLTNMSRIPFANILFSMTKSTTVDLCPGHFVQEVCPTGSPTSPSRPPSSRGTTRKSIGPKLSSIAVAASDILRKKCVSAIQSNDGRVYFEFFADGTTTPERILFDGNTKFYATKESTLLLSMALLLSVFTEQKKKSFACSVAAMDTLIANYNTSTRTAPLEDVGLLCDCVYYDYTAEFKGTKMEYTIEPFDSTIETLLQQAVRTHSMNSFVGPLSAFIQEKFSNITFVPESSSSPSEPSISKNGSKWFEQCKSGDFTIGFDWNRSQQNRIRPFDFLDEFIPNKEHAKLTKLIYHELNEVIDRINNGKSGIAAIKDNYVNAILVGKPGTGKTTTAEALSATLGMPIYTVKSSKNTEEDTFEGMTKVSEGSFVFRSTSFLDAYENGGIIVLEEFNLADPGVMQGALGQAIEYPFILMKDGYQEVRRHPLCVILSTMNTGTQGAREPNEALTSRSPITLIMDDPKDEEFLSILEKKGYNKNHCKSVYRAYKSIIKYLQEQAHSEEMVMCITLRHCLGALKLMSIGEKMKDAVYDTMIGSIAIRDLELANDVYKNAVLPLPEK